VAEVTHIFFKDFWGDALRFCIDPEGFAEYWLGNTHCTIGYSDDFDRVPPHLLLHVLIVFYT